MNQTNLDIVTGGAGFIGSHLVDRLLKEGRRVRVIDSLIVGHPRNLEQHQQNNQFELVVGDVADVDFVKRACEGAERIFHLAARADIVPSITHPNDYYRSNVDGTFVMLEAARALNIKRFVYIASSSCYGFPEVYPTPEGAKIAPQYPYALTKFLGEQLSMHWYQVYKLPVVSLRFFNVYGPRARTSGTYGAVFGVFLAQKLAGKPFTVVGDGTQRRDFVFVTDVAKAFLAAAKNNKSG